MAEPLVNRLKRPEFIALARLQDRFIEMVYALDNDFVMHGGTAIWRCYGGNRFSYDIDGYVMSKKESRLLGDNITWEIAKVGLKLKRIAHIGDALFITISEGETDMKVEIVPSKKRIVSISTPYEKIDGTMLSIRTLTPDDFVLEKINAYEERHYARDLYDIYQLMGKIEAGGITEKKLKKFINAIEPPLEGQGGIKGMVLSGVEPSFDDMVKYIRGKLK